MHVAVSRERWPPIETVRDLIFAMGEVYERERRLSERASLLRPAAGPDLGPDRLVRPVGDDMLLREAERGEQRTPDQGAEDDPPAAESEAQR